MKLKENQRLCGNRFLLELNQNSLSINDLTDINSGPDDIEIITNQEAGISILELYESHLNDSFENGYELILGEKILVHKDDRSDVIQLHLAIPNDFH
ncbi:hypothetical protein HQN89_10995 [Paenibacillus frigoriresistens]|uniref:hypothetical protein n=1 Tax=Paenibacillus alginolyticus TaxID=59839 RepID=UPI0015645573|nr:hypothetical protein [Paenibacillus frigoriresistens]NRF91546.1 hypothetical protein [Paenibacillus frigoriresistens]